MDDLEIHSSIHQLNSTALNQFPSNLTLIVWSIQKKIIEELILKSKENFESGNSKSQPLREQFNEKKEAKTSLQKEFDDAKNAHNEIKEKIAKLTEKQNELKLKMKGKVDPKQLEDRLE